MDARSICAEVMPITYASCRFSNCVGGWRQKLIDAGFQELVFEDAMDILQNMVGGSVCISCIVCSVHAKRRQYLHTIRQSFNTTQTSQVSCSAWSSYKYTVVFVWVVCLQCIRECVGMWSFSSVAWVHVACTWLLQVNSISLGPQVPDHMTQEQLENNFRDDMLSNTVVMFLRMVTSAELQRRQDFFLPFIWVSKSNPQKVVVAVAAVSSLTFCPHADNGGVLQEE